MDAFSAVAVAAANPPKKAVFAEADADAETPDFDAALLDTEEWSVSSVSSAAVSSVSSAAVSSAPPPPCALTSMKQTLDALKAALTPGSSKGGKKVKTQADIEAARAKRNASSRKYYAENKNAIRERKHVHHPPFDALAKIAELEAGIEAERVRFEDFMMSRHR